MDNREGHQPESIKSGTPPLANEAANGVPAHALHAETAPEADDAGAPAGFLSPFNMGVLVLMVCLLLYLLFKFSFNELWAIVKAVLGLSFVIFIHELGHFLAAKWCGVNVTTFSIGFGPPVPGCHFTWGETTYKLAILPLGGYVQMVGQVDGDESVDDNDDPRSYRRKTVSQRMLIISAGVIMNALLAVACFITVYRGDGKEHSASVINYVDTNAPAFEHGLPTGALITEIGGVKNPTFSDLTQKVINSLEGTSIPVTYQAFGKTGAPVVSTMIEPRVDENSGKPVLGISPASKLQLIAKRDLVEGGPYFAGTPAAAAKFEYGDVIIAMTNPDDPSQAKDYRADRVTDLPDDPRNPGQKQCDYFEFARRMQLLMDKEVVLRVRRKAGDTTKEFDVKLAPMFRTSLGAVMKMGPVMAIRQDSPAAGKVFPPRSPQPEKKLKGDVIEAVRVVDADGKTLEFKNETLDPERLPLELRQWSDRLDRAGFQGKRIVTLHLIRHSDQPGPEEIKVEVKLEWDAAWRFDRAAPISLDAPMPIPELGLAYQIRALVAHVRPGSKFEVNDEIVNFRYDAEGFQEETPMMRDALYKAAPFLRPEPDTDSKVKWMAEDLKEGQWAHVSYQVFQRPYKFKKIVFRVNRAKETKEFEVPVTVDETWPLPERGWHFAGDTRRVTASGPVQAVWLGLVDTNSRMMEIFQNLRGMVMGRISVKKNLGGPLTIARATYIFAFMDFTDFVFFLGLISINLAVVNFLPIPVLDGGHMVFLLYEAIRRKPASEMVRIWATYTGLAMILCLMIFVLYLDISRLFF